jgi:hypothetical protein
MLDITQLGHTKATIIAYIFNIKAELANKYVGNAHPTIFYLTI